MEKWGASKKFSEELFDFHSGIPEWQVTVTTVWIGHFLYVVFLLRHVLRARRACFLSSVLHLSGACFWHCRVLSIEGNWVFQGLDEKLCAQQQHARTQKAWHGMFWWSLDWMVGCKPTTSDYFLRVLELMLANRLGVRFVARCGYLFSQPSSWLEMSDFAVCTPLCGLGWRDAIIHMYKFFAVLGSIGFFLDLIRSQSNRWWAFSFGFLLQAD